MLRQIACTLLVSTFALGCTTQTSVKGTVAYARTEPVSTVAGERCTTIGAANALIAESFPHRSYLGADVAVAGKRRHALYRFDLGHVPQGAVITSARIRLEVRTSTGDAVSAHRITTPWSCDVTWQSFGNAYDREPVASAVPDADATFDVTELARAWQQGAPNHGVLFQSAGSTAFETFDGENPPSLTVCYAGLGDDRAR
jgi:hypothetical protein